MKKKSKRLTSKDKNNDYYITENAVISTQKESKIAIGSFALKYFPLREPIRVSFDESIMDDGGVQSEVGSGMSLTISALKNRNPYKVMAEYYGMDRMKEIIRLNLSNLKIIQYLHK